MTTHSNAPTPRPPGSNLRATDTQSGYLYHKVRTPPKTRHPRPRPTTAGTRKKRPDRRTDQAMLWKTLRAFVIAAVSMGAILYVANYINSSTWEKKHRLARQQSSSRPAKRQPPRPSAEAGLLQESGLAPPTTAASGLDPDTLRKAVALTKEGNRLREEGAHREGIEKYRAALDVWPYLSDAWVQMGRAYVELGDYQRAERSFARALENDPESAEILNELGAVCLAQQRIGDALRYFNDALEKDRTFEKSHYSLALCYLALKDRSRARDALEEFLRLKPGDALALRQLAFLDAADRDYESALSRITTALEERPDWPPLYLDAAAVAALLGQEDQSFTYLAAAEEYTSPEVVLRFYQEPAFAELRRTERGRQFEADLSARQAAGTDE